MLILSPGKDNNKGIAKRINIMKKVILVLVGIWCLSACAVPQTPNESGLITATKQFQPELFKTGARGEVIVSLSDNVSDDGFFSTNYTNIIAFKNIRSGEVFSLSTLLGDRAYDTAMLPVGDYEVINLYLQYVYVTTEQIGNTRITTTHIVTDEHYEGSKKITFTVASEEVTYIGHFDLIKAENEVRPDGSMPQNDFKLSDKSEEIPEKQKQEWKKQFGKDFVVRTAKVK